MSEILQQQEEVNLDEALLAMSTYPNGCDFKLIFEIQDGKEIPYLTWGCYSLPNLMQGKRRLLRDWLGDNKQRKIEDVSPYTLVELKMRKPCELCESHLYRVINHD